MISNRKQKTRHLIDLSVMYIYTYRLVIKKIHPTHKLRLVETILQVSNWHRLLAETSVKKVQLEAVLRMVWSDSYYEEGLNCSEGDFYTFLVAGS